MMDNLLIPPGAVLIAGGLLLPFVGAWLRPVLLTILPLVTLWLIWSLPEGAALTIDFIGYEMTPVAVDKLSRLFATVFAIMAFAGGMFALTQSRALELAAASMPLPLAVCQRRCFAGSRPIPSFARSRIVCARKSRCFSGPLLTPSKRTLSFPPTWLT